MFKYDKTQGTNRILLSLVVDIFKLKFAKGEILSNAKHG